jgi:ABC-type ATPase involved in cell division
MIRFDDVAVRYPRATTDALAGVSLEARRGALTAVVGPAERKSTSFRALIKRVALARGGVYVDDRSIASMDGAELAHGGVVTQRGLAFP